MTSSERLGPEEPWEAEIGELLGRLPAIDPPEGFLASSIDHRPLYAGRIMSGLFGLLLAALAVSLAVDSSNSSFVIPEIDQMAQRHLAAQADLRSGGAKPSQSAAPDDEASFDSDQLIEPMSAMPEGFERTATFTANDLRQAVYAREGEAISVFVQEGVVDWDALPASGRTMVGGTNAWVDADQGLTVVQAGDEMITIVGISSEDVSALIGDLASASGSTEEDSMTDRATGLASRIVGQLGFPTGRTEFSG